MVLRHSKWAIISLFSLILPVSGFSQDYGLNFSSHEEVVEQRTTLSFSEQDLCFRGKGRLDFNFKFRRNSKGYFGYLFRIMTSKGLNIDLVFKPSSPKYKFNLVIGKGLKALKGLKFDVDSLYAWNEVSVLFDVASDRIGIITSDTAFYEEDIGLQWDECLKMVFGRSYIPGIRSIDLPPMAIRDIKFTADGTLRHHWPLKEADGNVTRDIVSASEAQVINPGWIFQDYQKWHLHKRLNFSGPVSIAFNPVEESVLILSNQSLTGIPVFGGQTDSFYVMNEDSNLVSRGDQAIYYGRENMLININLNSKALSVFNFGNSTWRKNYPTTPHLTEFWHHNKLFNPIDSTLIMIGGYGNLKYKNLVQRYNIHSNQWDTLTLKGAVIDPRYLFGLGNSKDHISYLIGGYGSTSGDQMLYSQNYNDMFRIDWDRFYVEKVFEFPMEEEPFVFANSLVINDDSSYYGLRFPRFQFQSQLQLVHGSLTEPAYEPVGDTIPFLFYDIASYADLFFAKEHKLLVAVTTYFDNDTDNTTVEIHTIGFPPVASTLAAPEKDILSGSLVYIIIIIGSVILLIGIIYYKLKTRVQETTKPSEHEKKPYLRENAGSTVPKQENQHPKSTLRFFGGFYVYSSNGEELTNRFSPLLKELFLLIALNTLRFGKGVSSQQLDEILWFDKSERSARNNRSVNITKLKLIIHEIGIELSKNTGYWKLNFDEEKISIDYYEYLKIIGQKGKPNRNQVSDLIQLVGNGAFLYNLQNEWLDNFKSAVSTEIITFFNDFLKTVTVEKDDKLIINIANCIFIFDSVNEEAMHLQCKALSFRGNHTLAKNVYEKFRKEYFILYNENYSKTFHEIIGVS